jgi:hypothetical protein
MAISPELAMASVYRFIRELLPRVTQAFEKVDLMSAILA